MNDHQIKFIDGNFSPTKAKSVLLELLNHKIKYHEVEKLSNQMHYGEDKEHSENRIEELKEEKQQLLYWLDSLQGVDKIKIHCIIQLEIKNK